MVYFYDLAKWRKGRAFRTASEQDGEKLHLALLQGVFLFVRKERITIRDDNGSVEVSLHCLGSAGIGQSAFFC